MLDHEGWLEVGRVHIFLIVSIYILAGIYHHDEAECKAASEKGDTSAAKMLRGSAVGELAVTGSSVIGRLLGRQLMKIPSSLGWRAESAWDHVINMELAVLYG